MRTFLSKVIWGEKCFTSFSSQDVRAQAGRFYVRVRWTDYRRRRPLWSQLIFGSRHKCGLLDVTMYFNPGMPEELFLAFVTTGTISPDNNRLFIPGNELPDFDSLEDLLESFRSGTPYQWSCNTVLRTTADLMVLHRWLEKIQDLTKARPEQLGGTIDEHETQMTRDVLSQLTERLSTCQLNS